MTRSHTLRRNAHLIMAGLFLLAAGVQYNDPDPLAWIGLYGGASIASFLAARGRRLPLLALAVGLAALAWAAWIGSHHWGTLPPAGLFAAVEMKTTAIEEWREMIGLFLVALWMGYLFIESRKMRIAP